MSLEGHSVFQVKGNLCYNLEKTFTIRDSLLQIGGNFAVEDGNVYFAENAQAEIGGDFQLTERGYFCTYEARKKMAKIQISGDFIYDSFQSMELNYGEIALSGDLIQTEHSRVLVADYGFTFKFQGKERQKIQLYDPEDMELGMMDFRESAGVEIPDVIHGTRIYGFDKIGEKEKQYFYLSSEHLVQDETIRCQEIIWNGHLVLDNYHLKIQGNMYFDGYAISGSNGAMTVEGNLTSWTYNCNFDNVILHITGDYHSRVEDDSYWIMKNCKLQVDGDYYCNASNFIRLSNTSLQAGGNLTVESGKLYIESGSRLSMGGNLQLGDNAQIDISGKETELKVPGDFIVDSKMKTSLSSDRMILYGDLIQTEDSAEDSLEIADDFTIEFRGTNVQQVKLAHPSTSTLGELDFRNSKGVRIPDEIHGKQILGFDKIERKEKMDLYLSNVYIEQDETIHCADVSWYGDILYANMFHRPDDYIYSLTVQGNLDLHVREIIFCDIVFLVQGNLDLYTENFYFEYNKFIVKGDFHFSSEGETSDAFWDSKLLVDGTFCCDISGRLDVDGSDVQIAGDLAVDRNELSFNWWSSVCVRGNLLVKDTGSLVVNLDDKEIRVFGNFVIDSRKAVTLISGRMFLGGDLIQTEDAEEDAWFASWDFRLSLNGKKEQRISLQDQTERLGNIDLSECSSLDCEGEIAGESLIGIQKIKNSDELITHCKRNVVTENGNMAGDLYCDGSLEFVDGTGLTLESNFYQDGALKMGGGTLKVKGNYSAESSVVDVTDGKLTVDGDMDIKSDARLSLKTPESRLHVKGDLNISSTKADGEQMTAGAIEAEGDINCSKYASQEGFTLKGTKLILSGKEQLTLSLRNEISHSTLEEIDATQSAGVYIPGDVLYVKRIKGLDKITNTQLLLAGLSQRLERNELFRGSLTVSEDFLSLNGYTLQVTGNLTFLDTVFRPDQGTLIVGSSCFLHGSSVLIMIYADDLLQIGKDFRTTSSMNHSSVLRDGRIELSGNFEQSGDPCSFDSTDNFTMAFVGQGLQGSRFSAPEDSQFANTEGEYIEDYTFGEKVCQRMDAIAYGIVEGIGELMESPDEIIAAAAIALGVEVGAMLEIPLLGKVMAAAGLVGITVMAYQLRNEMEWINNDLERIQALAKYITKVIILAVVAMSGVKAADVIAKQFTYPVMWSKAIDVVHDNRIIKMLDNLEHSLDDIMTELYYSFSTAVCSADDIYAKLATMVDDDDALAYQNAGSTSGAGKYLGNRKDNTWSGGRKK